jgi:exodeoxyribonuclease VII large subunit
MKAPESANALTISEITAQLKELIASSFGVLWVVGEVSNFRRQASGHCYFTLKDAGAQLKCVMWRSAVAKMPFAPQDGMQVLARGALDLYEAYGQHQLVVSFVQPAGVGALQQAFEILKARLAEEGLFDQERKREIPKWPKTVGVITSGTGAAVRDIVTVIGRRMPTTRIIVRPAVVQGADAAGDISTAIAEMNRHGEAEVLIVGRGGGSLEDLWAFNEEPVVRAIVGSKIPVVSAVGHEIDFTLADFAADLRAATPSAAAEIVVPNEQEVRNALVATFGDMVVTMRDRLGYADERVSRTWNPDVLRRLAARVDRSAQDVDRLIDGVGRRLERLVAQRKGKFAQYAGQLDALSPLRILGRGYAVCEREPDGAIITSAAEVDVKDRFRVRLHRGIILGVVEGRIG